MKNPVLAIQLEYQLQDLSGSSVEVKSQLPKVSGFLWTTSTAIAEVTRKRLLGQNLVFKEE